MRRRPDFSTRTRKHPARIEHGLLVLAVMVAGLALLEAWSATRGREEALARAREARASVDSLRKRTRALEASRGRGDALGPRADLTLRAAPPRVVADLAALLPEEAKLDGLELRYRNQLELTLRVSARSGAVYDELLRRLVASKHLASVLPGPESREGEVKSSLSAIYLPEGRQ
jgi:hypothetical protein